MCAYYVSLICWPLSLSLSGPFCSTRSSRTCLSTTTSRQGMTSSVCARRRLPYPLLALSPSEEQKIHSRKRPLNPQWLARSESLYVHSVSTPSPIHLSLPPSLPPSPTSPSPLLPPSSLSWQVVRFVGEHLQE